MEKEPIYANLVRIGTVTDVDNGRRMARVKFRDAKLPSGWLYVLASRPYVPDYEGAQRTESRAGGSGDAMFEKHTHDLVIKPWMPKINATVLCLYLPIYDGDGFILGEIGELDKIKQWTDQS